MKEEMIKREIQDVMTRETRLEDTKRRNAEELRVRLLSDVFRLSSALSTRRAECLQALSNEPHSISPLPCLVEEEPNLTSWHNLVLLLVCTVWHSHSTW